MPNVGVTSIGETWTVSSEGVTPPSSLLRTHAPIPSPLPDFGLGLARGVFAGCHQPLLLTGPSRRYFYESFLGCLSPYPGGFAECICLVLPQHHRPSPVEKWVGFPLLSREHDFSRTPISRLQLFLYVQASEFACLPGRSYRCKFPCRAAEAFTSEQNVRRYLRTHRISYRPDYRQLAERGLSPRKIRSFVDCSSQQRGSPQPSVPNLCLTGRCRT